MTIAMTGPQAQLNLSVVALVALVAIVGLVALVLNSPAMVASPSFSEPSLESAGEVNVVGDAMSTKDVCQMYEGIPSDNRGSWYLNKCSGYSASAAAANG